jgi:YD repeat-containing protein
MNATPIPIAEGQGGPGVPYPYTVPMLVTAVMADGISWRFDYDSYGNVTQSRAASGRRY